MAVSRQPVKVAGRKLPGTGSARLMDHQDTVRRGDSKAVKTSRITFCTSDDVAYALTEEAHERRMSRSELIEQLVRDGLGI